MILKTNNNSEAAVSAVATAGNAGVEAGGGESKHEREIFTIATLSTALGLGAVFASSEAFNRDANGLWFHVSGWTPIAFAIGAGIGLLYWKIVALSSERKASWSLRAASFALLLIGLGAFVYPMRFLPTDQLPDLFKGLAVDVVALSLVGWILWQFGKFFEQDAKAEETREQRAATGEGEIGEVR